jgi:hypothetical protein
MQLVFIFAALPLLFAVSGATTNESDSNTTTSKTTSNLGSKVASTTNVSSKPNQTVSSTKSTPILTTQNLLTTTIAPTKAATAANTVAFTVKSTVAPIEQSTVETTEETTAETLEASTDDPTTDETTTEENETTEAITTPAPIKLDQTTYSEKKGLLLRCLTLGAHIHYLRRAMWKARNNEEVANNAPASNEVAVQLATLKDKFYNIDCNIVRRRLRYMRLDLAETLNALEEFSELFELLHMKPLLKPHLLKPHLLKPHLLKRQDDNIAYPQVVPSKGRNAEEIQE